MRGHIHKRVRKNAAGKETVRWYVVVDVGIGPNGRRRQKWHGGFATRREAEVARARIVSSLHSGDYVAPDRITVRDWVKESWLPMTATRVKPSTLDSYRSNMETHVLPALGIKPVQQLTAPMLNTLYAELLSRGGERGPLAPKTVRYIHTIIHKALADAVDAGITGGNVASGRSRRGQAMVALSRFSAGSRPSSQDSWSPSRAGDWRRLGAWPP